MMTDEGEAAVDTAAANLHTLAMSMAAMKRLLDRRDTEGAIVPADAALIRAALAPTHGEIRRLSATLTALAAEPAFPHGEKIPELLAATAKLHDVVDAIDEALRSMGG